MLFSSIPFLYYFLPAVLLAYFAAPRRAKNAVLLLFSLLFYRGTVLGGCWKNIMPTKGGQSVV